MSDLIWAAYFIVGGFFAGPVVRAAYDDMRRNDAGSSADGGSKLMFLVIVAAFAWLAWPLTWSFKRAGETPQPNTKSPSEEG